MKINLAKWDEDLAESKDLVKNRANKQRQNNNPRKSKGRKKRY